MLGSTCQSPVWSPVGSSFRKMSNPACSVAASHSVRPGFDWNGLLGYFTRCLAQRLRSSSRLLTAAAQVTVTQPPAYSLLWCSPSQK